MTPNNRNANKTVPTGNDVAAFVESIADETRKAEARLLVELMTDVTGQPAVMWGPSIVGFGTQHLTYASGRQLAYFRVGFAPRKAQSVLYVGGGFDRYRDLLPRLGRHATGKGCLYLKSVADADPAALRDLVSRSYHEGTQ
jgi:hypothetical protein